MNEKLMVEWKIYILLEECIITFVSRKEVSLGIRRCGTKEVSPVIASLLGSLCSIDVQRETGSSAGAYKPHLSACSAMRHRKAGITCSSSALMRGEFGGLLQLAAGSILRDHGALLFNSCKLSTVALLGGF